MRWPISDISAPVLFFFKKEIWACLKNAYTTFVCVVLYSWCNSQPTKTGWNFSKFYIFNSFIPVLLQLQTPINYKTIYITNKNQTKVQTKYPYDSSMCWTGMTHAYVSNHFHVSIITISRLIIRLRQAGSTNDRQRSGRLHKTSHYQDHNTYFALAQPYFKCRKYDPNNTRSPQQHDFGSDGSSKT